MELQGKVREVYVMLVDDVLIIAASHSKRRAPFKVIYLEGLAMRTVQN
jgi:hypothetical protein